MITIKLKPNDSMERAMTKLKNIVIKEGLYKELKDRRYYAKPSLKKRRKREESARQRVKDQHKDIRAALRDEENFLMWPIAQISAEKRRKDLTLWVSFGIIVGEEWVKGSHSLTQMRMKWKRLTCISPLEDLMSDYYKIVDSLEDLEKEELYRAVSVLEPLEDYLIHMNVI